MKILITVDNAEIYLNNELVTRVISEALINALDSWSIPFSNVCIDITEEYEYSDA